MVNRPLLHAFKTDARLIFTANVFVQTSETKPHSWRKIYQVIVKNDILFRALARACCQSKRETIPEVDPGSWDTLNLNILGRIPHNKQRKGWAKPEGCCQFNCSKMKRWMAEILNGFGLEKIPVNSYLLSVMAAKPEGLMAAPDGQVKGSPGRQWRPRDSATVRLEDEALFSYLFETHQYSYTTTQILSTDYIICNP